MIEHNQQSALLGKIAAYTELLVNDPRSTIFVSLAETYRKLGLFEDARDIITRGLELHPDSGPAHVVLARIECQLDNYEASCAGFERALILDPNSLAALVGYARVKLLLQRPDEARELLLHARNLSPADPVINKMLLGLPGSLEIKDEPQQAAEVTESAKKNLTSLASTTLADLYLVQGLTDKALALYRQLLSRNPDDLDLRRKIKELEGREEQESTPAEKTSDADSVLTESPQAETDEYPEEGTEQEPVVDRNIDAELDSENGMDSEISCSDPQSEVIRSDFDDQAVFEQTIESEHGQSFIDSEAEAGAEQEVEQEVGYMNEPENQPSIDTESHKISESTTEIIAILNQWLDNIRQRREHV